MLSTASKDLRDDTFDANGGLLHCQGKRRDWVTKKAARIRRLICGS